MLSVSPGATKDINFGYEVKYPKGREVTLE
jgi:hypothetical protein